MPQTTLSVLLRDIIPVSCIRDPIISGLSLDSRKVKSGDLFLAYKGTHLDGRDYIPQAIAQGASAILAEGEALLDATENSIPLITVPHLARHIGAIAAKFFNYPTKQLRVVGVTGTNGKTSCTHFIANALNQLSVDCGLIGTLGAGVYGRIESTGLTTPDAVSLQEIFAELVAQRITTVAMEVSSHSIDQERINAIDFEIGIFTNLTRDHLDYHGTMENYGATKKRLFDNPLLKYPVINADDAFGQTLIASLSATKDLYTYGIEGQHQRSTIPAIIANNVVLNDQGMSATVVTPWGTGELTTRLVGQFNLSNLLAALTALCLLEIPFHTALDALSHVQSVPGRMETYGGGNAPLIVIDYAHTPDALEKVLSALRNQCQGKLYCVFGCGGDRDKGKRPLMAQIAERYADEIIVTNDNPRHEEPTSIINDIMQGFSQLTHVIIQEERSKAIQDVIQCAKANDCILIAGKGAEAYQQVGDTKIPFSDKDEVTKSLIGGEMQC